MPNPHAPYPPAFKSEAVRLVHSGEKSIAAIAKDLGISDPTLRSWVHQAEIDDGTRDGLTTSEPLDSRRLQHSALDYVSPLAYERRWTIEDRVA